MRLLPGAHGVEAPAVSAHSPVRCEVVREGVLWIAQAHSADGERHHLGMYQSEAEAEEACRRHESQQRRQRRQYEESGAALGDDARVAELRQALRRRHVTTGQLFSMMDADRSDHVSFGEFERGIGMAGVRMRPVGAAGRTRAVHVVTRTAPCLTVLCSARPPPLPARITPARLLARRACWSQAGAVAARDARAVPHVRRQLRRAHLVAGAAAHARAATPSPHALAVALERRG